MERIFRIDFYPHEWLAQTGHMTAEQRGVFIQVCALIYASKGKIRNDPHHIGRVANCSSRLARSIIDQLVQTGDLQIRGEFVTQKRCELELNKKRTHLESSSKGGRNKRESDGENNKNKDITSSEDNSTPPSSSLSLPRTQEVIAPAITSPPNPQGGDVVVSEPDSVFVRKFEMPDGAVLTLDSFFERMWLLYPAIRDKGHKGKAREQMIKKLKEGVSYEDIGRGVARYRRYVEGTGEKQPDFFRWLRDDGFTRPYEVTASNRAAAAPRIDKDEQRRAALTDAAKELGLID